MTQRENILKELNDLQSNLGAAGHPCYKVPEGYFDGLAGEILKRVRALESTDAKKELEHLSPLLSDISKKTPYTVPEGFFNELSKNLEQVSVEEEPETSPLLSGLKHKTTYKVPGGYFENLPGEIFKKIVGHETKIVSITSRKWFRYAAAATVIAFVALMGFLVLGRKDVDPDTKSYAWVKQNLKKVSTDEINEFVELATVESTEVVKLDTRDEISSLLKDVSDKEIQDFLNETQLAENGGEEDLILN